MRFKVGHNLSKSGESHIILVLNGFTLNCCAVLIGFVAASGNISIFVVSCLCKCIGYMSMLSITH